ncbi:endoplasmic reticulum resident protein 44 isoform X1 [Dendroctonus ponderosae]
MVNLLKSKRHIFAVLSVLCMFYNPTDSGAVELTEVNFEQIMSGHELVMINFYADWCRFSNLLRPIYDDAADAIAKEFPDGKAILAKVDCDQQPALQSKFQITKYPTLKLMRNGKLIKKEFRGHRSVEAFTEFIKKQLEDPIKDFKNVSDIQLTELDQTSVIGYFDSRDQPEYQIYRRVVTTMQQHKCQFYAGFGESARNNETGETPTIIARSYNDGQVVDEQTVNRSKLSDFDQLFGWMIALCSRLIREITFENAEELTEEGLPFLILFYKDGDRESIKKFTDVIQKELTSEQEKITFLTADGNKFAHPLHHLGKGEDDLPVIAIDSFKHMYLFPKFEDIQIEGKLKSFIMDLYSGKLHREFHYGPDSDKGKEEQPTKPPESTFKKLAPSKNRYTLLKDEL